jgi:hypothetical protein
VRAGANAAIIGGGGRRFRVAQGVPALRRLAAGAAPPPRFARWTSSLRIAADCLAMSALSSTTAVDTSDLVFIPLGPQKFRPHSSPVVSGKEFWKRAPSPLSVGLCPRTHCCQNLEEQSYVGKYPIFLLRHFGFDCWLCAKTIYSRLSLSTTVSQYNPHRDTSGGFLCPI